MINQFNITMQQLGGANELPIEGFDGNESPVHLKQKQKKMTTSSFFAIPEAKPLLSKNYIDWNKPKVLIRQVKIKREPIEFKSIAVQSTHSIPHQNTTPKPIPLTEDDTIWNKYILSERYSCVYAKYLGGRIEEYQQRNNKKLRLQILKRIQHNTELFATPIIDLSFLSDSTNASLLKNLVQSSVQSVQIGEHQEGIQFDSRFQCGNLAFVFEKKENKQNNWSDDKKQELSQYKSKCKEYWLILQNDVNTKGYANWFYFSIKTTTLINIKLNIINLQKPTSLFQHGMHPFILQFNIPRSNDKNQNHNDPKNDNQQGYWHPGGRNIRYERNQLIKADNTHYNTLSFELQAKGLTFVAATLPYSYSKMIGYVESIEKMSRVNSNIYIKRQVLGVSISSNQCPMLTLTWKRDKAGQIAVNQGNINTNTNANTNTNTNNNTNANTKQTTTNTQTRKNRKKIIVIIARQHPCQTVSSFVLEGIVNYLVYLKGQAAVQLLKKYIFKIVCMVNVDGVIYGNSRCDINGADTNRKWRKTPNKYLWPILAQLNKQIYHLLSAGYQIEYFIDLHGHSKKNGFFIYTCPNPDQLQAYVFPFIMDKINNKFMLQQCRVGLSKGKMATARGWAHPQISQKVMTIQTSFHGYTHHNSTIPWQIKDLHQIGSSILQGIYAQQTKDPSILNWESLKSDIKQFIADKSEGNKKSTQEESGSDSMPSEDQFDQKEAAAVFLPAQIAMKLGVTPGQMKAAKPQNTDNNYQEMKRYAKQQKEERQYVSLLAMNSDILKKNERKNGIREVKSVTKIQPFKFTLLKQKKSSSIPKIIKIAIDIHHSHRKEPVEQMEGEVRNYNSKTKNSNTQNTQNQDNSKSRDFWQNLKKEYQTLVEEKKKVIMLEHRKSTHRMLHLLNKY